MQQNAMLGTFRHPQPAYARMQKPLQLLPCILMVVDMSISVRSHKSAALRHSHELYVVGVHGCSPQSSIRLRLLWHQRWPTRWYRAQAPALRTQPPGSAFKASCSVPQSLAVELLNQVQAPHGRRTTMQSSARSVVAESARRYNALASKQS